MSPLVPADLPDTVLVTGRATDAGPVVAALRARGCRAVTVHTSGDARSRHVADESVLLGDDGYDDPVKLVEAARQAGAQAVHPAGPDVPGLRAAALQAGLGWLDHPTAPPEEPA